MVVADLPLLLVYLFIINENGVKKCIERLNEKKASGPDKIPIKVLKQCSTELAPILTCIFQQSLSTGEIPLDWKHANVGTNL